MRKLTQEEAVNKAIEAHCGKYTEYGEYNGSDEQWSFKCPIHGRVTVKNAYGHLMGRSGCPICGKIKKDSIAEQRRLNAKNEFISKAKMVHNNKYDYSKVDYIDANTKICIICPEHGEFLQTPNKHLNGRGCNYCANKQRKFNTRFKNAQKRFVNEATKVHNGKYVNYGKYKGSKSPIEFDCPIHGRVSVQQAGNHLRGAGCPLCKSYKMEDEIREFLKGQNIHFIEQTNKSNLSWLNHQSLDFYLPEYKVGVECQGRQHFCSVDYFGGEDGFEYRKKCDKRKAYLCQENGVKLLYYSNLGIEYPYKVFEDKNKLLEEIKRNDNSN